MARKNKTILNKLSSLMNDGLGVTIYVKGCSDSLFGFITEVGNDYIIFANNQVQSNAIIMLTNIALILPSNATIDPNADVEQLKTESQKKIIV